MRFQRYARIGQIMSAPRTMGFGRALQSSRKLCQLLRRLRSRSSRLAPARPEPRALEAVCPLIFSKEYAAARLAAARDLRAARALLAGVPPPPRGRVTRAPQGCARRGLQASPARASSGCLLAGLQTGWAERHRRGLEFRGVVRFGAIEIRRGRVP